MPRLLSDEYDEDSETPDNEDYQPLNFEARVDRVYEAPLELQLNRALDKVEAEEEEDVEDLSAEDVIVNTFLGE